MADGLEHHPGRGPLSQLATHPLGDDLAFAGLEIRVVQPDLCDRNRLVEADPLVGRLLGLRPPSTLMLGDGTARLLERSIVAADLAEVQLAFVGVDDPPLGLLAEELALEPLELAAELFVFAWPCCARSSETAPQAAPAFRPGDR